jgi:hypothetical protein
MGYLLALKGNADYVPLKVHQKLRLFPLARFDNNKVKESVISKHHNLTGSFEGWRR